MRGRVKYLPLPGKALNRNDLHSGTGERSAAHKLKYTDIRLSFTGNCSGRDTIIDGVALVPSI